MQVVVLCPACRITAPSTAAATERAKRGGSQLERDVRLPLFGLHGFAPWAGRLCHGIPLVGLFGLYLVPLVQSVCFREDIADGGVVCGCRLTDGQLHRTIAHFQRRPAFCSHHWRVIWMWPACSAVCSRMWPSDQATVILRPSRGKVRSVSRSGRVSVANTFCA